ncbi:MAG: 3-hydroxyisobutyrate dehydrogenase [Chloroflexi bacterium]|nr:3-hydroxyisobutyrate dehydrogenase [Chloroflexota bacterium]
MTQIAFLGLGNMGAPMSLNLMKAGHSLTVFDIVPSAVERIVAVGAQAAPTAAAAVQNADVVISMLPASLHVEDLYLGAGQVLANAKAGALLIECSTIATQTAVAVGQAAAARGFEMIDAPVSGGTAGATDGTLTFMVGGPATALERARPLLEKMGRNIFHAGGSGAGQTAKACNNMLLAIHMIGTAEALNLGVSLGLDPKVLAEIMGKSSGRNWSLEVYNPYPGLMENAPASRGYQGGFGVDLMLKDLGLAMEAALAGKAPTPLGAAARNLYHLHSLNGNGRLDFSSIIKMLQAAEG